MRTRTRRVFVLALWAAFLLRGSIHALIAPLWDGFDEPFHAAYVLFVAEHGRPPGFTEPSFPASFYRAQPCLPTFVRQTRPDIAAWHDSPGFDDWRRISAEERARRRASCGPVAARDYAGSNYERQQPPLFYFAAAPVAAVSKRAPLPVLVVSLRLFCVLLASLVVPLSARLLRLVPGSFGLLLGLPFVALLPNGLFFACRITNDALAWPIAAALALELTLLHRRPTARGALRFGLLAAAGIWTKGTLLPAFPAALAVILLGRAKQLPPADRRRLAMLCLGLPVVLAAPLFVWNRLGSGSWTGLIEAVQAHAATPLDYVRGLVDLRPGFLLWQWWKTHLWAGGWAFRVPGDDVYGVVATGLAAVLVALAAAAIFRLRARSTGAPRPSQRLFPLVAFFAFFLAAMVFHAASFAVTGRILGTGTAAGGEGWYFDLMRPVEAALLATLAVTALRGRALRAGAALAIAAPVLADAAGTLSFLLPFWAGYPRLEEAGPGLVSAAVNVAAGARAAAPVLLPAAVWGALGLALVGALAAALRSGLRKDP